MPHIHLVNHLVNYSPQVTQALSNFVAQAVVVIHGVLERTQQGILYGHY